MRASKRTKRTARQLFRLCLVDGRLDESRVRGVVQYIVASRRRHGVSVLTAFERLVKLDRDRHTAVVESAVPLGNSEREGLRAGLIRAYGPALETSFAERPSLIGGMRIKVGSDVYDDSVQSRLAALESRL
jgi:F-type H+-transporting ATPase subunit delta